MTESAGRFPIPVRGVSLVNRRLLPLALILAFAPAAGAQAPASSSFVLTQATVGGAGETSVSASYVLDGTLGQESPAGEASSASYRAQIGFWTGASVPPTPGTIRGLVWTDYDADGVRDAGEPGLDGVGVILSDGGGVVATTTTAGGGLYGFADVSPGTYSVAIDTSTLPPGYFPSYDLDGTVTPHIATVTVAEGAHSTGVDFGYQPRADLELTKTASDNPLPRGKTLVYRLTVENLGPADATNVIVTDVLPAGETLVATSGCAADPVAVPECALGPIAAGSEASYTIQVSIDSPRPASIRNTASVAATQTDPVPGNGQAGVTTALQQTVLAIPVLAPAGLALLALLLAAGALMFLRR